MRMEGDEYINNVKKGSIRVSRTVFNSTRSVVFPVDGARSSSGVAKSIILQ
jgi:hypothetical protein